MKNALRNLSSELLHAIWFYKVPLMVFFAVASLTTGHITVAETTLLVVLAIGILLYDILIEVSE